MTSPVPARLDPPRPSPHDPGDMLGVVEASPDQWRVGTGIAHAAAAPVGGPPRHVAIAGMGGSGIAGDIAAVLAYRRSSVPVTSVHGDTLPGWVGPESLVVLVSHSGETAETLACADQAVTAGARLAAVTCGGGLGAMVADAGGTVVEVPAGLQPRASIGLLTAPVLGLLDRAGVAEGLLRDLDGVPDHLDALLGAWGRDVPPDGNPVRRTADQIGDGLPWFLGAGELPAVVALRGRNQVAENAKRVSVASALPEADHNELVGWAGSGLPGGRLLVLRRATEPAALTRRVEATIDLARPGFASVAEHRLVGDTDLQQLAAGVLFVDLLSAHLALQAQIDPTPVHVIDELKRRL